MSRADWWILAALVPGQIALLVWSVNVSHGLAPQRRWLDRFQLILFVALWLGMAWASWEIVRRPSGPWPWPALVYALACLTIAYLGLPIVTLLRARRRV